ncbi:MAG: OmpW family protein [Halioglobus sp.]
MKVKNGFIPKSIFTSMLLGGALLPATANAFEANSWIVRAGISQVAPDESSDQLQLNGSEQAFIDAVGPADLSVDNNTQLGLTFEYMLTDNWGIEVLAATPFEHTASGTDTLSGLDVADIKHLPPTVSAIYHFNAGSAFRPYVGAGINYTIFFDEDLTSEAESAFEGLGLTGGDVELDDSWGLALQVGADYNISGNWWLNASVRWIDISTTAEVSFDGGTEVSSDVDIDPFVYSIKIAYAF